MLSEPLGRGSTLSDVGCQRQGRTAVGFPLSTDELRSLSLNRFVSEMVERRVGLQKSSEEGLPLTDVLVLHRQCQGLAGSDKDSEVSGPCQSGVNEVFEKHLEVLGEDGNDDRPELTPL